jgi:hypothetical protein
MKRKHKGSNFEEFLAEDGILDECRASAVKFKIAHKNEKPKRKRKSRSPKDGQFKTS